MSRPDATSKIEFIDPVNEKRALHLKESKIALAGHPIHAMLVAFPIALTMSVLGADLLYWWTGDVFWAIAAGWAAFGAFLMAVLAAITGTVELLMVPGIRNRAASWTHFVLAMTLLSILGLNWMIRIGAPEEVILPLGLALSFLAAGMTAMTGWHGGKLVFDYQIGTKNDGSSRPSG
ncbi:DUF2231 domain-containing protein [Roseinatronobacter sp. S2]|uniref:DUF2231 domain-containing protein n=1 Tax=Roseinatronobacter sp. S2 TaxID=3035471 RepID=UPI00240EB160|nr:DUF2231 domain-containing protein [Roseinatronobacter sp. S2]WFE76581.1 DUF2231 domain-containing protein [Roseinatronobacter sp. S2]